MVSALVDQDSTAVRGYVAVDDDAFDASLDAALRDGRPDVVKVGMLASAAQAERLAQRLTAGGTWRHLVVDPVMTGGVGEGEHAFAGADAYRRLLALPGTVVTPNAGELAAFLGTAPAETADELVDQAAALHAELGTTVLAKAGHVEPAGADVLAHGGTTRRLPSGPPVDEDVHGTGCRLASAIAAHLARGESVLEAVGAGRAYLADSFVRRRARIGDGRTQFVPVDAVLRGPDRSDN